MRGGAEQQLYHSRRLEAVFEIVTAQALSLAAAEAHFDAAVKQREALERLLGEM